VRWFLLILVAGIGAGEGIEPMYAQTQNPITEGLEVLPVEFLPEYVIGFPVYVAITVRARPNSILNNLRFADFLNLRESIGLEMSRHDGGYSAHYEPKPIISLEAGALPERLQPGETRRMLADVSSLVGAGVIEGDYAARFSYVSPRATYMATPVTLRFRKPAAAEKALLATAAPDRPRFPNWGRWTLSCSHADYDGPITPDNPLRFNLLLQRLFCGPEPPAQVDPQILDVLTGLFQPEGSALKAELLHARNDIDGYHRARAAAVSVAPGLAWWMEMLDHGGAYLKTFRARP
jgi:hypothetical protein